MSFAIRFASGMVSTTANPRQQRAVQDLHEFTIEGEMDGIRIRFPLGGLGGVGLRGVEPPLG